MMNDAKSTVDFFSTARMKVLTALATQGPLTVPELPRGWPITRSFVTVLAEQIVSSGLAEWSESGRVPGKAALRITKAGEAWLAGGGEQGSLQLENPAGTGPDRSGRARRHSLAAD